MFFHHLPGVHIAYPKYPHCLTTGEILIARCSTKIIFFRHYEDTKTWKFFWEKYYHLKHRGFIYHVKPNLRFQITTEKQIYFYTIDSRTLEPRLENVMNNFMQCNHMCIGRLNKFCVTYRINEKKFSIFRRKYQHNLRVKAHDDDYEGSMAVEVSSINCFMVTKKDKILIFELNSLQLID